MRVRNWRRWQSYRKDRGQPPWIKVHRALMRDEHWVALSDAQRGHLVAIWMLAADRDGECPDDPKVIKKLCFMSDEPDLKTLVDHGFMEFWRQPGVTLASTRRQHGVNLASPWRQPDANMTPQSRVEESREEENRIYPPQAEIVTGFKQVYEEVTGQPFNAVKRHYVISSKLLKTHGYATCVDKIRILAGLCKDRSVWFTKEGFGTFTLETLTRHWNSILPALTSVRDNAFHMELKRQEEIREKLDRPV